MASGTKLGNAYMAVDADTSGADSTINSWAKGLVGGIGKVGLAIGASLAAGAVAGLVGLEKIGSTFDGALDDIQIKTGATGKVLEGLQDSFKDVFASVPVSADDASAAIGGVNQLLGLTGKPLEALSTQFLNLSRLTKTELGPNVENVSKVFNQFGIAAEDQTSVLDGLFRLSQQTGTSVSDLASSLLDGGVAFRAAGLTFEQSAGLLGQLNKAGLDTGDIIPALSKAMAQAAKDGKSADEVFRSTFDGIKNASSDTEAAGLALDVFGAKAGPKLAALVRDGTISLEDLTGAFEAGQVGINETAAATDDWREKLQLLMNKAMVKLEPIATKVFTGIGTLIEKIVPVVEELFGLFQDGFSGDFTGQAEGFGLIVAKLGEGFRSFVDWFSDNWPKIKEIALNTINAVAAGLVWWWSNVLPKVVQAFQIVVAWVQEHWPQIKQVIGDTITTVQTGIQFFIDNILPKLIAGFQAVWAFVQEKWPQIRQTISDVMIAVQTAIDTAVRIITFIWENFGAQISTAVENTWNNIQAKISAVLDIIQGVINAFTALLKGDWGAFWDAIKQVFTGVWDFMFAYVSGIVDQIKFAISVALDAIGMLWSTAWDGIKTAASSTWDTIKSTISGAIDEVVGFVRAIPGRLLEFTAGLFTDVTGAATTAMTSLKDTVSGAMDEVVDFVKDLPVRLLEWTGALASAGVSIGSAIIGGVRDGISGALDFVGDLGTAVKQAVVDAANWVIHKINDAVDFTVTIPTSPFTQKDFRVNPPDIPDISFHRGGVVPGPRNADVPINAQGGEMVLTRGQQADLFSMLSSGLSGVGQIGPFYITAEDATGVRQAAEQGVLSALAQYTRAR